ncbi:MAG: hypothetical protein AB1486_14625 [Planctomycetota bacterium]
MKKSLFVTTCVALLVFTARAQEQAATQNETRTDGKLESGWVASIPSGSSDFFSQRHDGISARPIAGVSICSYDWGSDTSYPLAGLYDTNFTLDPSGNTPDLYSGVWTGPVDAGVDYTWDYVYADLGGVIAGPAPQHVVVQFPAGDSGQLGVGADSSNPPYPDNAWTRDGYSTPAWIFSGVRWGLHPNIDAITELQGQADGRLRATINNSDITGDFTSVTVAAGDDFGVVFFSGLRGTVWMVFLSYLGSPIKRVTGAIPTIPSGAGAYLRSGGSWPYGLGGFTFNFVAVSGKPGVMGSVGVSNEITVEVLSDPSCEWGTQDDCTFENGYIVAVPTGSSDFFNVNFKSLCGKVPANNITDIKVGVMDFGTLATAYPLSGAYASSLTLDPTGITPDLSVPYSDVAPFTFPAGTFATTCQQMIVRTFSPPVPYSSVLDDNVHGVVQFPPGDSALLAIAADTNSSVTMHSGWTYDGYMTPAIIMWAGDWGIRLGSN